MTQTTLAKRTGLSRQTLHRAIHSDELTSRVAKKIANAVGADLLSGDIGGPALVRAKPSAALTRPTRDETIPSGAPDDAAEMAGQLTPLGEVLEILRRDRGDSQDDMAAEAEISLATYRRVITGSAKAKDEWLRLWGEAADLDNPKAMLTLKKFNRGDAFAQAVGRQIHAWRVSAGLDLIDVADACGESVLTLARFEAGDDENTIMLEELAPLFGTSSEVIFRGAALTAPPDDDKRWRPPVERVMSFEAAQTSAREQQVERDRVRDRGGWDLWRSSELAILRIKLGLDPDVVAARIGRSEELLEAWEANEAAPLAEDFERMATVYRRTPWELQYGDIWQRALAFPNADESRSVIFGMIFTPEMRAWMYRALAEFAALGVNDIELMHIRETLTNPDHYAQVVAAASPEEAEDYVWAALVSTATDMWRTMTDPAWVERPASTWKALSAVFTPDGFDPIRARELMRNLRLRHTRMGHRLAEAAMSGGGADAVETARADQAASRIDAFAFYRTTPRTLP